MLRRHRTQRRACVGGYLRVIGSAVFCLLEQAHLPINYGQRRDLKYQQALDQYRKAHRSYVADSKRQASTTGQAIGDREEKVPGKTLS
eukprot:3374373-Rhodomonas_salina.3